MFLLLYSVDCRRGLSYNHGGLLNQTSVYYCELNNHGVRTIFLNVLGVPAMKMGIQFELANFLEVYIDQTELQSSI